MIGKNTSDYILVDLKAESEGDDVGNAWTAIAGIALLQLYDGRDEFPRWAFRPRSTVSFVAEQAAIFTFDQRTVKFEQSRWLDDYRNRR